MDSKPISEKEKIFLALCFLIIITVLLHIFFLENKFIDGDDLTRVVQNPLIQNISLAGFVHDISGFMSYHYPPFIMTYFWGIIFSVWDLNHIGFHFISFLMHAVCTGLLFLLLVRITDKIMPAFIASLLFGLHPVHCETVNWVSRQDMILSVLLGLAYLHVALRKGIFSQIVSTFFLLVAIFISPICFLFIFGEYLITRDRERQVIWWKRSLIPAAGLLVVWGREFSLISLKSIFTIAPKAVLYLLQSVFMPWKIHFMLPILSPRLNLFCVVSLFLILVLGVVTMKTRSRVWGTAWLALVSAWLFHSYSERFNSGLMYIPLFWIAMCLGLYLAEIEINSAKLKWVVSISFLTIFTLCFYLSYERNQTWKNTDSLLKDALAVSPSDAWLLSTLGHYKAAFLNRKETEEIFKQIKQETCESLCLKAKAQHLLLNTKGSYELFKKLFQEYPLKKKDKYCLFDFAVLHIQTARQQDAKKLFYNVTQIDPYFIYAWHDLGTLFIREKNGENGLKYLKKVLTIAPAYRPTLENIAFYYMKRKDYRKALYYIRRALKSTSCHDTQRFYKGWLKKLKEQKPFRFASLQWADLKPPG